MLLSFETIASIPKKDCNIQRLSQKCRHTIQNVDTMRSIVSSKIRCQRQSLTIDIATNKNFALFKEIQIKQQYFEDVNNSVATETMPTFTNSNNKTIMLLIDASDKQIDVIIRQEGKTIACRCETIQSKQRYYSTTSKEILAIVEAMINTFKTRQRLLLGRKIRIVSDHKILSCLNLTTREILRWIKSWILKFSKNALKLTYIRRTQCRQ